MYYYTSLSNDNKIVFKVDDENKSFYQGTYPKFLNMASEVFRKFDKNETKEMENILLEFIDKFTFDNTKKFPPLMLEGLFLVSTYKKELKVIDKVLQEKILNDIRYKDTINSSTSHKIKIEERLNVIYENC
jgi:hypothetical protein